MPETKLSVARPVCRHLLSKGMFVTGEVNPGDDPTGDYAEIGDSNCWCNRTQNCLGPDDQLVDRDSCVAGRGCFEARL